MRRAVLLLALVACGDNRAAKPDANHQKPMADARPDSGPPVCDIAVDPDHRCAGDVLHVCAAGVDTTTNCAASGQTCAWVDDTTGYGCVAAGDMIVSGKIEYEDKPPQTDGSLGAIVPQAARGARVSVIRDSDRMSLADGSVADDGTYRLHYAAMAGQMVHVLASSYSPLAGRPVRVTNRQGTVHGFGGTSFAAAPLMTSDLLVTAASTTAEAFNILDQLIGTMDKIRLVLGHATPVPLIAEWQSGSTNGTYYVDTTQTIHLLGRASDDDGYDDTVILHESGHHVEATEGRSDSPGGSHDGSPTDPRLAWSEGFSTYWEMYVRGNAWYMDSNSGGGWSYNADTEATKAPMPTGPMTQDVSEDMVNEILWDLGDGAAGDDDGVDGKHDKVVRVQVDYLKPGVFRAAGVVGVDLVDFLDGWFLAVGLTPCAGARGIITTTRLFPYDYAGPAGACP